MGYLDHSTNNIIVDAVLTDYGRKQLATNGNLNIDRYGFADNEVDYTIIRKYGTVIGKEKIEKNTPIMEASTRAATVYNYLNNNTAALDITSLPTLTVTAPTTSLTSGNVEFSITYAKQAGVEWFEQTSASYGDVHIYLKFDNRFLLAADATTSVPTGIADPANPTVFSYVEIVGAQVPSESSITKSITFTRNSQGSNLTSILTNNTAAIPVTAIAIGSGLRKTGFITVDYTNS